MKRILLMGVVMLCAMVSFTGCSKDDDTKEIIKVETEKIEDVEQFKQFLVGHWTGGMSKFGIWFKEDGTFETLEYSGTWWVNNDFSICRKFENNGEEYIEIWRPVKIYDVFIHFEDRYIYKTEKNPFLDERR